MSDITHEEAHTGPIRSPKQLFWASLAAFVLPVFIIIGLVMYVTSANQKAPGASDIERGIAERLQKVGSVEIRDANRALKSGEEVFKAQCAACHTSGAAGAPKVGDAGAWGARIAQGYDTVVKHAIEGLRAMPAKGGNPSLSDDEMKAAVDYIVGKSQ